MYKVISPSILTADLGNLAVAIQLLDESRAEWIHLDIMDGVFVPNISFGFPVVRYVRSRTKKTLDVHLMIADPDRYVNEFCEAGADVLTVHVESCNHLHRTITHIQKLGMKAGVSLNPHTPLSAVEEVLDIADMFLIMSVNPGFGGQSFIPSSVDKVRRLRDMIVRKGSKALIEIDGGVSTSNARELFDAGCDVLVAGNAVFSSADPKGVISQMLDA